MSGEIFGRITRGSQTGLATLTTSSTTTPVLDYTGYASGEIYVPAGSSLTTLTWYGGANAADTMVALQDSSGTAVTQTVAASKAYPIPVAALGAAFVAITGNAGGTISYSFKG